MRHPVRRFIRWLARYELALQVIRSEGVGYFDGYLAGYQKGHDDEVEWSRRDRR